MSLSMLNASDARNISFLNPTTINSAIPISFIQSHHDCAREQCNGDAAAEPRKLRQVSRRATLTRADGPSRALRSSVRLAACGPTFAIANIVVDETRRAPRRILGHRVSGAWRGTTP